MTKRKQRKRKSMKPRRLLRNQESQTDLLQKTFNSGKAAIFVLDAKDPPVVIGCNRAASEIFGYKKSEMVGRPTAFLHASDESLRKFQAQLYPAIEKQEYFNLEYQMKRKDGSVFPSDQTVTQLFDDHGKRIGSVRVITDIIERTHMEKALKESEARYRLIAENMTETIWLMDMNLKPTYISPSAVPLRGYTLEELYALPLDRQMTPDSLKLAWENFKEALSEENLNSKDAPTSITLELEFYRKDGSTFWNESTFTLVRNSKGEPVGILGVGREITERKRADEKLRHSEERYRSLFDRMLDGVYRSTHEGRFVDVNPAFVKMFGYSSKQEMLDITDIKKELYFTPEERGSHILGTDQEEVKSYRMRRKDGSEIWVEDHGGYVHDEQGNIIYHEGLLRDITERKRLEEELKQYSLHLEELVAERTRELRESEAELVKSQRLAAIGETAAMVGHDLRNPLQGIVGALYLLKQESLTAEERNEMLQVIEKSVHYSDAIIRDLSEYSAEIKLKLAEATPKSITRDATEAIEVPQNVTLQNLSEDQPTLRVDPDRMKRVFINLIENAIDAMPQGGTLTISSKKSDGNVEIAMTDTGSGMSEKVMENLWKPLQTTKAKGLGLGLAICKRIMDAHGGSMSAKSEVGRGTTLTIQLPVRPVEVKQK